MSSSADQNRVAVFGVDQDLGDVLAVFETKVGPILAAVGGFVDAITHRNTVASPGFSGTRPNDTGIRVINGHGPNRLQRLPIEYRFEGGASVNRFPNASTGGTDYDRGAPILFDGVNGGHASAHRCGTDVTSGQARDGCGIEFHRLLSKQAQRQQAQYDEKARGLTASASIHLEESFVQNQIR